jgi:hypothetical protein
VGTDVNPRHLAALTDPLSSIDVDHLRRCRHLAQAGDGALLTVILAVDR